jgi:hypothetical protein
MWSEENMDTPSHDEKHFKDDNRLISFSFPEMSEMAA